SIKSAIKRVKTTERNRQRNRVWKSSVRTVRSDVVDAVKGVNAEEAHEKLKNAYAIIDRAVAKGALHKNSAARRKSRLAQQVLKLGTEKPKAKGKAPAKAKPAAKPKGKSK